MEKRKLGNTDLVVSRLGVGLAEISDFPYQDVARVYKILDRALENGINFFDTAACYGNSEELIGRTMADRRDEYYISTKAGHVTGQCTGQDWTANTVHDSIDRSLRRMRTDHLDIVHLHSCDVDVLERGDVIRVLQDAKQSGKTRYIGYSGDNESAKWAIESGYFDTLQTSYNLVDQLARTTLFPKAEENNMGIIAKRPIANAVWGTKKSHSSYAAEYHRRAKKLAQKGSVQGFPENSILLALGFALDQDAIDTAIVGTRNPEHMEENIRFVEESLPISKEAILELKERFDKVGSDWRQQG